MTSRRLFLLLTLIFLLVLSTGEATAQEDTAWEPWGPHVDEIFMPISHDHKALVAAFERGEIHVMPGLSWAPYIDRIKADPNAEIVTNYGHHIYYLCFNMRRKPLDADVLRQAIAHLVDRDSIIAEVFQGTVLPLSSFLPPSSSFYRDDVPARLYDPAEVAKILDAVGYTMDTTTKIRKDPAAGKQMRELRLLAPSESPGVAKMIAQTCSAVGLPVKAELEPFNAMRNRIDKFEFDMYVLATTMSRFPTSLDYFFHSSQDTRGGYNKAGIRDSGLDKALEEIRYARDLETAKRAADEAQLILAERQPWVTIYSRPYIDAFRKDKFIGYVPMHGEGAASNLWTLLNIRSATDVGGVIHWPLTGEPETLNPCTSTSAYESEVLDKITDGLIEVDPETLETIPWMAREWEIGTWEPAKGKQGTVITWYLHDGILWQDGEPFTSADIKFTIEYLKKYKVPRYVDRVQDIVKVESPDPLTAKVYFSTESCWHLYNADLCFLPQHIWKSVWNYNTFSPWLRSHPKVKGLTRLIGVGPFILKEFKPGEYVRLVKNPLYWRLPKETEAGE